MIGWWSCSLMNWNGRKGWISCKSAITVSRLRCWWAFGKNHWSKARYCKSCRGSSNKVSFNIMANPWWRIQVLPTNPNWVTRRGSCWHILKAQMYPNSWAWAKAAPQEATGSSHRWVRRSWCESWRGTWTNTTQINKNVQLVNNTTQSNKDQEATSHHPSKGKTGSTLAQMRTQLGLYIINRDPANDRSQHNVANGAIIYC